MNDAATILVVEDNDDSRQLMEYILRSQGHRTLVAGDGAEAVELAREHEPDLVLMDIQMPGMDGYQALQSIREQSDSRAPKMVAVTAFAMVGDRDQVIRAGFDGYISKPIEPRSFADEVGRFL